MEDRRFSREEAEKIFAGAARLQQDNQNDAESALTLAELEAAARDAGIDARYVRAAAAELLRPSHAPHVRSFLGVPVEIRESKVIPGPAANIEWGDVVSILRRTFGKHGTVTDLGLIREWTSDVSEGSMPVRVVLEPEGESTRLTIERKMWPSVAGIMSGAAATLSVGLIVAGMWFGSGGASNIWVAALVLTLFSIIFGGIGYLALKRDGKKTLDRIKSAVESIERVVGSVHSRHEEVAGSTGTADSRSVDLPLQEEHGLEEPDEEDTSQGVKNRRRTRP